VPESGRGQPAAFRTGAAPGSQPVPALGAPHLDDGAADRELHLTVELVGGTVCLHGVPGGGLVDGLGPRPAVWPGEPDGVAAHTTIVPQNTLLHHRTGC
jgi:hypothetical protein